LCVQFVGFTLTMSSENAIVGLDYTFTCVTTERYIVFTRDNDTICIITGGNSDGTCAFIGEYIANYTYTCNLATYTYTVAIPGSYLTDSLHGTTWQCKDRFGGSIATYLPGSSISSSGCFLYFSRCYNLLYELNHHASVQIYVLINDEDDLC
jgi:hypothetical protein